MNWIEQVTILDLLVKGLIVGVVVSAPLGPVGVLCIQRTLNKGRWYGFVTGLGAALSDIGYALITGYGMSFMDDFLAKNQVLLQIIGSIMLFFFGIYTFRSNPVQSIRPVSSTRAVIFIILLLLFCDSLQPPHYIPVYRFVCPFFFCDAGQSHRLSTGGVFGYCIGGLFSGGSELRILSIKYAPVLIYAAFGF